MKWIKIEEGCEMPELSELVAVAKVDLHYKWWDQAVYDGGIKFYQGEGFDRSDLTHWARVDLPEER